MQQSFKLFLLLTVLCFCISAFPQTGKEADPQSIAQLLSTYQGANTTEEPVIHKNSKGFVRFLSAPEGGYFATPDTGQKSLDLGESVRKYIEENLSAFSSVSDKSTVEITNIQEKENYSIVRLKQNYKGLPVFGSGIVVKVTKDGKVTAISCDVLRDDTGFPSIDLSQPLPIDKTKALEIAKEFIQDKYSLQKRDISESEETYLAIYDPSMLKLSGAPNIVYVITLLTNTTEKKSYRILIDVKTGEVRLHYPLQSSAIDREIYDANGSYNIPTSVSRKEGDKETGIADVDNAFEYLGDVYNFFKDYHDRDSYDAKGATLRAVVRIPFQNAYWDPTRKFFWFGTGFVVDDVVGHEFTHAVVENVADLVYFGEPGAITESLCDMWGEFVDLTNGKGLDTDAVRWLIGEELPSGVSWEENDAIRSMKDPTLYNQPDRYNSPLFIKTTYLTTEDYGGVHTNSGVGNKLVYLLTDGDTFNGEQVRGFGLTRTAKLFYDALELLPPVADYTILALALNASAVSQGLSIEDRFNLSRALRAVEILPEELLETSARDFRATALLLDDDTPAILLTWTLPEPDAYSQVTLVKKAGSYPISAVDGEKIYEGRETAYFLDVNVSAGIEYFYSLFVDMVQLPPVELYDSAIAGGYAPQVLTQEFNSLDPREPIAQEIIYSQIYFIPVGPPVNPLDGNKYLGNYYHYDAVFIPEVFSFPVKRQDQTGTSYTIPLSTDGLVSFNLNDVQFPFFGKKYGTIYIGANGYISFAPVGLENTKNFPSLASHFAIPRISFLFSNLAPDSAGEVWTKRLPDRFVITFESVPKNASGNIPNPLSGANPGSSVQVELFFSGHIRITYLQLDPNYSIVGLSDGRGVPVDPGQILTSDFPYSLQRYTDFTQLPSTSSRLSILPSPLYTVLPNQNLTFDVSTQFLGGTAPQLYATWLRNETPPFADLRNGKGKFSWTPKREDEGSYYLRVTARLGDEYAYQDIPIIVNPTVVLPQAVNLRISSQSPVEDTSASRVVSAGRPLVASYDYIHPLMVQNPAQYTEGLSILYWFRNHEIVPALTNYRTVPPNVTRGGDIWYFRVIPVSISGLVGEEAISPIIYIVGQPQITSIYPNRGKITGGELVRIRGSNFIGLLNIKFGGIPVPSFRFISETEIEVTTPQSLPGIVDVYIQTVGGTALLPQAFEFYEETPPPTEEPKKRRFIISCGNISSWEGISFGDILILVLLLAGLGYKRFKKLSV